MKIRQPCPLLPGERKEMNKLSYVQRTIHAFASSWFRNIVISLCPRPVPKHSQLSGWHEQLHPTDWEIVWWGAVQRSQFLLVHRSVPCVLCLDHDTDRYCLDAYIWEGRGDIWLVTVNQSRLSVYVISPQFTEEILRHCPTQWRHRVWSWVYLKTGAKLQNNPLHRQW